jgi:dihydroorotase
MIDAHVHLRDFSEIYKEDYFTGTSAALAGGVTSVIDMPNNSLPTISLPALEAKKIVAQKKALCNVGFHFGATSDNFLDAKIASEDPSVAGLKIYMGSSTGTLLVDDFSAFIRHLENFKKTIVLHAEDEHAIRHFSRQHGATTVMHHGKIRNDTVAELAVGRAISSAKKTGAKIHIAHVSTSKEISLIDSARKKIRITCEVSPHHLFLDETIARTRGNFAKVNPPLRRKKEVANLWMHLKMGKIDMLATDHAPHSLADKQKPYEEAPSGMPELDTALLLLSDAASKKRITYQKIASLYSYMPSKVFKIKNKGEIAIGKDADLVILDPKKQTTLSREHLFTKCQWTPYEGKKVNGRIEKTILAGKIAYDGESIYSEMGSGGFLEFGRSP